MIADQNDPPRLSLPLHCCSPSLTPSAHDRLLNAVVIRI